MLIEKPYSVGDTVTFKTVAGEEVVARVTDVKDDSIKIKKHLFLTFVRFFESFSVPFKGQKINK